MSFPVSLAFGAFNSAFQLYQSGDLAKKVLVVDTKENRILHRASPFAVPEGQKMSAAAIDSNVLNAKGRTCLIGGLTVAMHMGGGALGLAAVGVVSTAVNLYFQNSLSYDSVMQRYMDAWKNHHKDL